MGQMVGGATGFWLLRGKHGTPARWRNVPFDLRSIQGELIFVDTAEQFYAPGRLCTSSATAA
jgi:hypothetical protein